MKFLKLTIYLAIFGIAFIAAKHVRAADVNFTVSAWVRPTGTATAAAIMVKDNEIRLVTDANSRPACQIHNGAAWQTAVTAKTALAGNKWKFVVCVYDGANLKIYLDGAESGSRAETNDVQNTANPWRIGADAGGTYSNWLGYIDEVKIYPYARTAAEIRQDYAAGVAGARTRHGAAAAFGSASDSWLTDGLVGYWKFDESATTSGAIDSSGNGNTGTYYGNASTTAGKFGNGGSFATTTGDYVEIDNESNFDFKRTDAFSVSAWIYRNHNYEANEIIAKILNSGNFPGWEILCTNDNNQIAVYLNGISGDQIMAETNNDDLSTQSWHHVVVVYDGSNLASGLNIYIDGTNKTTTQTGNLVSSIVNNQKVWIGRGQGNGAKWDGKIDEVRIYNRTLSPEEVRKLYEWGPRPVGYWKLDENNGTSAYDSSTNNRTGILSNGAWVSGKYGSAVELSGNNSYLELPDF